MDDLRHGPHGWLSRKLESRDLPKKGGNGVFALAPIARGELLLMWSGTVVETALFETLSDKMRSLSIQIEEDLYLVTIENGPEDNVNHSCEPNAGLYGQIGLVAMRDIEAGEEICFDYAMSDASDYDEFDCRCDTPSCRKRVTGQDWQLPELQVKYEGYFSSYIQRLINTSQQMETATEVNRL